MLKNKRCFTILLPNKCVNLLDIVHKLALNHHIRFNKAQIDGYDEYSYVDDSGVYVSSTVKTVEKEMGENPGNKENIDKKGE